MRRKSKFFDCFFLKKGYDSAIQIPRLAAKPLVTHTTYTHYFFYIKCATSYTTHTHEKTHFISKEKYKLKIKTNTETTKITACVSRSLRAWEPTASLMLSALYPQKAKYILTGFCLSLSQLKQMYPKDMIKYHCETLESV